jgi:hypothetical protein
VISAIQRRFGADASKHRYSRSDGRPAGSPGTVVRGLGMTVNTGIDLLGFMPAQYRNRWRGLPILLSLE